MFGRENQQAETPDDVMEQIEKLFNEGKPMYDPCPHNPTKDGLEGDWEGDVCYVNPPYKNVTPWLKKGLAQMRKGKKIIFLIPARCDVEWWHNYVLKYAYAIYFIKQGIRFKGYKLKCPFAICIVVFEKKRRRRPGVGSLDFYEEEKRLKKRKLTS